MGNASDWNEVTVGDQTDDAYTEGGGSSNRCCWALQALELVRDIGMILARSICGVSKDGMVVKSVYGWADCIDDREPVRDASGGGGPMKWDGPVNCGKDGEGTYCIAMNIGYYEVNA
jgi:hypothetical protein